MSSSSIGLTTVEGPGSVSEAPHLPEGFTDTFRSRYVDTGKLRLHAVIGGGGPPLLLVHGWPQTWYAWRLVMPALDEQFEATNAMARRILSEPNFTPNGDEWIGVWQMMSVFERMSIMVDDGILDIAMIDRLHGFRLLILIGNENVYQRLQSTGGEWQDFIHMCHLIADHREHSPDINDADRAFITRVRALNKHARKVPNPFAF